MQVLTRGRLPVRGCRLCAVNNRKYTAGARPFRPREQRSLPIVHAPRPPRPGAPRAPGPHGAVLTAKLHTLRIAVGQSAPRRCCHTQSQLELQLRARAVVSRSRGSRMQCRPAPSLRPPPTRPRSRARSPGPRVGPHSQLPRPQRATITAHTRDVHDETRPHRHLHGSPRYDSYTAKAVPHLHY